ncbi:MAG TPA: hypothetical protein EYO73_05980 [Sulfurimonas sp.]|nr:hypothetical protein [Sulfurimonas sp.]
MNKIILVFLLLLFTGCSSKKPGVEIERDLWPYELYNKFNLRTLASSYSNYLKHSCLSYPKDFFRPDQVYMPDTQNIVIKNKTRTLSFELYRRNYVIVTDEVKDSFSSRDIYKLYYNEEFDDYRVDMFFIKEKEDCTQLVIFNDENVSQ